jgi:hypothetical protein
MSTDELAEALRQIDAEYDLGAGFLLHLRKEADWSFVVKAHALIEAAVSQLLTHHVGDQRLSRIFERLELSNTQTGRLAFAKALDVLTENEHRFVRRFSELRNRLVHNVHNVRFRFVDDLAAMDPNQRAAFLDWIAYFAEDGPERRTLRAQAERSPKHVLWQATLFFVLTCLEKTREAKQKNDRIRRALDLLSNRDQFDDDD